MKVVTVLQVTHFSLDHINQLLLDQPSNARYTLQYKHHHMQHAFHSEFQLQQLLWQLEIQSDVLFKVH